MIRLELTLTNGEVEEFTRNDRNEHDGNEDVSVLGRSEIDNAEYVSGVHVSGGRIDTLNLNKLPNLRSITFSEGVRINWLACFWAPLKNITVPPDIVKYYISLDVGTTLENLDELMEKRSDLKISFI